MKNNVKLVFLFVIAGMCFACTRKLPFDTRSRISLGGQWGLRLDTTSSGFVSDRLAEICTDSLLLPGTTDIGKKGRYNIDMTQTNALSREYIFEGIAFYS